MKAGAFTPATLFSGLDLLAELVGRSMKAGAFTPATPERPLREMEWSDMDAQ